MKKTAKTKFIGTKCKTHEFIPTDIVLQLDMLDPGYPLFPPMFDCEKCDGLMKPNNLLVIPVLFTNMMVIN